MHSRTHSQAVFRNTSSSRLLFAITSANRRSFSTTPYYPMPLILAAPRLRNESRAVPFVSAADRYIVHPWTWYTFTYARSAPREYWLAKDGPRSLPEAELRPVLAPCRRETGERPTRLADMCFRRPRSRILELELHAPRAATVKTASVARPLAKSASRQPTSLEFIPQKSVPLSRTPSERFVPRHRLSPSSIVRPRESRESLETTTNSLSVRPLIARGRLCWSFCSVRSRLVPSPSIGRTTRFGCSLDALPLFCPPPASSRSRS